MYYQPTNKVYSSLVQISDISGNYILGSKNSYVSPLFLNNSVSITYAPNFIIQTFNINSVPTTSGSYMRIVTSNVGVYSNYGPTGDSGNVGPSG
jgi:hypothetical protein